ncbi:MAG: hypothetical protein ACHQ49_03740 [Elusimicrobiota bacterium]
MKNVVRALVVISAALVLVLVGGAVCKRFGPSVFMSAGPGITAVTGPSGGDGIDKVDELAEILRSRNDNDPRLDRDFNGLTPEAKRLFRKKYEEIPAEKRNQRGTVVYLLGKNLRSQDDWEFLRGVALEPPCLSLRDCAMKPAPDADAEDTGDDVTLAYPSLVALRQARLALEEARTVRASAQGAGEAMVEKEALSLFADAKNSKSRAVARMAAALDKKFGPR